MLFTVDGSRFERRSVTTSPAALLHGIAKKGHARRVRLEKPFDAAAASKRIEDQSIVHYLQFALRCIYSLH